MLHFSTIEIRTTTQKFDFSCAGHIAANVAQTLLTRHPAALEVQWDRVLHYAPCARLWQARRSMGLSSYLYTGQVAASAIGSESLSLGYLPGGRHRRHLAQLHWNVMASALINQAQCPIIYASSPPPPPPFGPVLLAQLAERGNIPVCTALQGLSAFDETHEKSLHTRLRAEVIIALGSRFNDRVTMKVDQFASGARAAAAQGRGGIIHFEILPKNVNKVASMPMPSPAYTSASSHIARLAPRTLLRDPSEYLPLARARVRPVCPPLAPRPLSPPHPPSRYRPHVSPPRRPRARRRLLALFVTAPAPCVACVSPMPAVAFTPCVPASHPPPSPPCPPPSPRALLLAPSPPPSTPCPPCTRRLIPMSRPPHPPPVPPPMSHPVPAVTTGLATAFQFRIAVKVLVLNNEFQGMMQQWQDGLVLLGALSHSHTRRMTNPDFVLLAQAMGVHALRCETAADLPVQMAEFLAYDNNK
ncbi:hypothetical protein B0H11DRAFT_2300584 [Mycena galericulata]|nr:hypothetical protein B0H11DRAFT_2300584 [Mycena galericulata]